MTKPGHKMTGKVKWYNSERNFGFIDGRDGESYFVHLNEIKSYPKNRGHIHLRSGDRVRFEVGEPTGDNKQPQALDVMVILP